MASTRTTRHAKEEPLAPQAPPAPDGAAPTWRASGLGMQPGHESGGGNRSHDLTAEELHNTHPATYQKVLAVVEEAHMNPDSAPADVLEDLVPILTDDKLKKTGTRRR